MGASDLPAQLKFCLADDASIHGSGGAVERLLRLPEVPVEALVDAAEEIGGGVDEAGRGHGPRGDAADEGVAGGQLLPVLAVEGRPGVPAAVVGNLASLLRAPWQPVRRVLPSSMPRHWTQRRRWEALRPRPRRRHRAIRRCCYISFLHSGGFLRCNKSR